MHIHPACFTAFRCFDALAIDHRCARLGISPSFLAHLPDQGFIDRNPQPIPIPTSIIAIDDWPRLKINRQHAPLATCAIHINDRIQDLPHFPFAWSTPLVARKEFLNLMLFGILHVGRVSLVEFGHSPILSDHLRNTFLAKCFLRLKCFDDNRSGGLEKFCKKVGTTEALRRLKASVVPFKKLRKPRVSPPFRFHDELDPSRQWVIPNRIECHCLAPIVRNL